MPGSSLALGTAPIDQGTRVRDREAPAPDRGGVALGVSDSRADDVVVDALGRTVAEANPSYPADDRVVEVVWDGQVPGLAPLGMAEPIGDLRAVAHAREDLTVYHFPASRLVPEAVICDVPPADLRPAPYHERCFDSEATRGYIDRVRSRGYLGSVLIGRETDAGFELVEGHKRRWVAEQAGLETVAVRVVDLDDWEAAVQYARDHLPRLETETAERTRRNLMDRWGNRIEPYFPDGSG